MRTPIIILRRIIRLRTFIRTADITGVGTMIAIGMSVSSMNTAAATAAVTAVVMKAATTVGMTAAIAAKA
jgi:hypothetical protein